MAVAVAVAVVAVVAAEKVVGWAVAGAAGLPGWVGGLAEAAAGAGVRVVGKVVVRVAQVGWVVGWEAATEAAGLAAVARAAESWVAVGVAEVGQQGRR